MTHRVEKGALGGGRAAAVVASASAGVLAASILLPNDGDRLLTLFPAEIVAAAVAGGAVGRWWALALALAVPALLAFSPNLEPDREGSAALAYAGAAFVLTAAVAAAVGVGVAARRIAR